MFLIFSFLSIFMFIGGYPWCCSLLFLAFNPRHYLWWYSFLFHVSILGINPYCSFLFCVFICDVAHGCDLFLCAFVHNIAHGSVLCSSRLIFTTLLSLPHAFILSVVHCGVFSSLFCVANILPCLCCAQKGCWQSLCCCTSYWCCYEHQHSTLSQAMFLFFFSIFWLHVFWFYVSLFCIFF